MENNQNDALFFVIDSLIKSEESIQNKIISYEHEIKILKNEIQSITTSLKIDVVLRSLSAKAIGSKYFSERLNSAMSLFDIHQFNKIIRFLTSIEEAEADYNKAYAQVMNTYISSPENIDTESIVQKFNILNYEYTLMNILINNVETNKVMYSKIYNHLEDRGIFLSSLERKSYSDISQMASDMGQVVNQIARINSNLNILIEEMGNLSMIVDSELSDISTHLWDMNT